jgi:Fic-DOC domain mobile mystery protein B
MIFEYAKGQTPIPAEEAEELIPPLTNQAELNEWEETNILEAAQWALESGPGSRLDPLTATYLKELHRRMFQHTWKWAGKFRLTDKNIGVSFYKISVDLQNLLDDASYWRENKTFPADELSIRFHHRLVSIHLFPNGNGRHARLVADVLAVQQGRPAFSWGKARLEQAGHARTCYLDALAEADGDNYTPLLEFSRS